MKTLTNATYIPRRDVQAPDAQSSRWSCGEPRVVDTRSDKECYALYLRLREQWLNADTRYEDRCSLLEEQAG